MKLYIENIRFTTLLITNLYEFTNLAVQINLYSKFLGFPTFYLLHC
jgi:hypothetical protein